MKGMRIMKRFIKRISLLITASTIGITSVMPIFASAEYVNGIDWVDKYGSAVAFNVEITDSLNKFVESNGYGIKIFSENCNAIATYDGENIIITITDYTNRGGTSSEWNDMYRINIEGSIRRIDSNANNINPRIKFVLPDNTVYTDCGYAFQFLHVINEKNNLRYGYDERGNRTRSSNDAINCVTYALYDGVTFNEPKYQLSKDVTLLCTWEDFDKFMRLWIDAWHYRPDGHNELYFIPENLDKVLAGAKGTRYEDLVIEWVDKVKQEKEDYDYWQEMKNNNTAVPTAETIEFTDVTAAHWANANVRKIANLGYFSGYEDGTFRPDNQITHEEFLKVIVDLGVDGDVNDAPANPASANWASWAQPYLNTALDAGIVKADDTDLLAVNTPITRGEMAKVIGRLNEYNNTANTTTADVSGIADWNAIPDEYKNYVAAAYSDGILAGYDDGTFKSDRSLTRAEASSVIVKLIDKDEPTDTVLGNVNTIIEPTANARIEIWFGSYKYNIEILPVIMNNECMIAIDNIANLDSGTFMYKKSTNSVQYTTNTGFLVANMPVSTDGKPIDYEFNRWGGGKETIHFDTPIQIINGKVMIPASVLNATGYYNVIWSVD